MILFSNEAGSKGGQKLSRALKKSYAHRLVMPAVYSYGKDTVTLIPSPTEASESGAGVRGTSAGGGSLRYSIKPGLGAELEPQDVLELGLPGDAAYEVNA